MTFHFWPGHCFQGSGVVMSYRRGVRIALGLALLCSSFIPGSVLAGESQSSQDFARVLQALDTQVGLACENEHMAPSRANLAESTYGNSLKVIAQITKRIAAIQEFLLEPEKVISDQARIENETLENQLRGQILLQAQKLEAHRRQRAPQESIEEEREELLILKEQLDRVRIKHPRAIRGFQKQVDQAVEGAIQELRSLASIGGQLDTISQKAFGCLTTAQQTGKIFNEGNGEVPAAVYQFGRSGRSGAL